MYKLTWLWHLEAWNSYHCCKPLRLCYTFCEHHHLILLCWESWQLFLCVPIQFKKMKLQPDLLLIQNTHKHNLTYQLLNSLIKFNVILSHYRDSFSRSASTRCTAYPMNIVLGCRLAFYWKNTSKHVNETRSEVLENSQLSLLPLSSLGCHNWWQHQLKVCRAPYLQRLCRLKYSAPQL